MSFLSDIGNIFHSIGHFFNNNSGDSNSQPYHPATVNPILTGRAAAPYVNPNNNTNTNNEHQNYQNTNNEPNPQAQTKIVQQAPQQQGPSINLFQGGGHTNIPLDGTFNPGALQKANPTGNPNNPNLPFMQHVQQVNDSANQPPTSPVDRTINTVADSAARTAIGIPQGVSQLFDLLTPGKGSNRLTKALDKGAKAVDQDQEQNGIQGRVGSDVYHGLQVAENLVPGAVGAVSKGADLVKAAPDLIRSVPEMLSQAPGKVADLAGSVVDAAKTVGSNLDKWAPLPDNVGEVNRVNSATDTKVAAGVQAPDEVEPGIKSVNPNQGADALQAIQEKEAQQQAQMAATAPQTPAEPAPAPAEPAVPAPTSGSGATAPSAPNLQAQFKKDLETAGHKAGDITNPTHDVLSDEDLNTAAQRYVQTKSDQELVNEYANGAKITDAASLARAKASLERLGKLAEAGNDEASTAIENILDGAAEGTSNAGRTLKYVQNLYDTLPKPAKVKYLVKSINSAREKAGLAVLSDEEEANAEATIDHFLTETENAETAATTAQGEIEAIKAKIGTGQLTQDDLNKIAQYDRLAKQSHLAAGKFQGDLARAYDQLAPAKLDVKSAGERAGNLGRSLMLTSFSGRASDIATTSVNMAHSLTQNAIESLIGKGLNAFRSAAGREPGKYVDTLPSGSALVRGTGEGLQKAAGNYRGNAYVDDVQKAIKTGSEGGKAQLQRAGNTGVLNKVRNFSHAMAETATNLSQGAKNTKVLQLAYQEGKTKGLEGLDLDVYAHATAATPSRVMAAKGEKLVEEINNMNDNPFTHGLETLAKGFDKVPVLGEQIRNLIAPFNRWVGGQMWNGLTDKNVVANIIKGTRAAINGDSQEAVHQLAGVLTNGVGTMGAGYALANAGVLTNTNASGYNDDGLYLHLGGHYIPVSFFGFAAPGIVMGWATHEAFKDNTPGKSIAQKIMDTAGKTLGTLGHSYVGNTVIGGGSELLQQVQDYMHGKDGTTGQDVAASAATDAAGNYIPGAAGDVNAAVNTFDIGGLNPNHEAALTKVTKGEEGVLTKTGAPSSAKDIPRTDLNQLLNKVPVLGQKVLPRNPGVAANDFGSRITRGDNESPQQAGVNSALSGLPGDEQKTIRTDLNKTSGAAQIEAQKAADALTGPAKVKSQETADKLKFAGSVNNTDTAINKAEQAKQKENFVNSGQQMKTIGNKTYANINGSIQTFDNPQKAQAAIDLQHFKDSGKQSAVINGKVYAMIDGSPKEFDTALRAQQALDEAKFKAGNQKEQSINGMVYQRGSDGKVTAMEQKDYDYKTADQNITEAKSSGDLSGYKDAAQRLLGNIQWQLNHADLTDENRNALAQKAAEVQAEFNRTNEWGDFSKPKGADSFKPEIANAKDGYVKAIQAAGAKYGLDINALLSVAAQEGLGGGVGDNGHAFGPFQMNNAVGVIKDMYPDNAAAQKFAESPEGIDYAIQQIARVAAGKTGDDAIRAIVSQFERPADPEGEIARAIALYHGGKATLSAGSPGSGSIDTSNTSGSGSSAATLIRENKIGSVPQQARESFIDNLTAKPITLNIPQVKLTPPESLIKAHKITVGMPKA